MEKPIGSNPTSPGREPSRVSGLDPNGRAFVPSFHWALREVDALEVWVGANAAAEPARRVRAATFMVFRRMIFEHKCRKRGNGLVV